MNKLGVAAYTSETHPDYPNIAVVPGSFTDTQIASAIGKNFTLEITEEKPFSLWR